MWASVGDFVDDRALGVYSILSQTTTQGGTCAAAGGSIVGTSTYDSAKRLVSISATAPGSSSLTRYITWDSLGRPTQGTLSGTPEGGCGTETIKITYDDVGRTVTTVITSSNAVCNTTAVSTFDADGNQIKLVGTSIGGTNTNVTTVNATSQVCK